MLVFEKTNSAIMSATLQSKVKRELNVPLVACIQTYALNKKYEDKRYHIRVLKSGVM
jgi:hypothetical protein